MNVNIYSEAIQDTWIYLLFNLLPLFIGGIVLLAIVIVGLSKHLFKKTTVILLLALCVIILAYSIIEVSLFGYDIQNGNFEIFYGEFNYMQVSGNRKDVFEVTNELNLYIRGVAKLNINTGSHSGYLLYGKTSHWVIAYSSVPFEQ